MTRQNHGTGLGLPLACKLVDLLGGSFALHSEVGVGTTIEIQIPTLEVWNARAV
jgi:two-component system sensor histidine kinase EvgS